MVEKEALISVIVPYHNSEKYVVRCIESVISQSYEKWELLLVDDASSDCSKEICISYAEIDCRIQSITSEGRGVSSARNSGLQVAKGDYITFVDSDDWLDPDALKTMLEEIKDKDFLSTSYQRVLNDNYADKRTVGNKVLVQNEYIVELFNSDRVYQGYCWGKLYRMSIIRSNGVGFNPDFSYNEDRLFVLEYVQKCAEIVTSDAITYNYRIHSESAMGKTAFDEERLLKSINDEIYTAKKMLTLLKENKKAQEWLEYNLLRKAYCWKHLNVKKLEVYSEIDNLIRSLRVKVIRSNVIGIKNKLKVLKAAIAG